MKLYWKRKTEEVFLFLKVGEQVDKKETIKNIIILAVLITSVNNMRKKNKYTKEKRGA